MSSHKKHIRGRPMKYDWVLMALDDDGLYTPADIADKALAMGLNKGGSKETEHIVRCRVRISMGRYKNNHRFPVSGDGMVVRPGQAPTPAWLGSRWKERVIRQMKTAQVTDVTKGEEIRAKELASEQRAAWHQDDSENVTESSRHNGHDEDTGKEAT